MPSPLSVSDYYYFFFFKKFGSAGGTKSAFYLLHYLTLRSFRLMEVSKLKIRYVLKHRHFIASLRGNLFFQTEFYSMDFKVSRLFLKFFPVKCLFETFDELRKLRENYF